MSTFKISPQFNADRLLTDTSVNQKIAFLYTSKIIILLDFMNSKTAHPKSEPPQ